MKTRVTLEDIEDLIADESYTKIGHKMTVCLLTLKNGHEVIGISGCVDPANYDLAVGGPIARQKAVDQLWGLAGYALQVELASMKDKVNSDA